MHSNLGRPQRIIRQDPDSTHIDTEGKSGIQFIEQTLAQYGSRANAPVWLQPTWDKLVSQFGASSQGEGQLQFGHALNNLWISGGGADGRVYQYTDLGDSLYQFSQAYAAANPALLQAIALEHALNAPKNGAIYASSALSSATSRAAVTDPDRNDTGRYGQEIADLRGTAGANGGSFTESTALKDLLNNRTGISMIEETLAHYQTVDQAPYWLAPLWAKLVAQFGTDANGSGQMVFSTHINDEHITGVPGVDFKTYEYSDYATTLYQLAGAYAQAIALEPDLAIP